MSNGSVTDETILEGFRSLAQAMSEGFDNMRAQLTVEFTALLKAEIGGLRSEMNQRFGDLEHRMMRRFDQIDERLDNHERRITALEAQR
jgi:hypothetical protein